MAFFDFIKSAFEKFFKLFRKGLDQFLAKYTSKAKEVLEREFESFIKGEVPLDQWKGEAWKVINETFNIDGKVAGNWITLLLSFAYEMIRKEQEAKG